MKKQSIITLILLTLLCSVSFISTSMSKDIENQTYQPILNATYRPIFAGTDGNATVIYDRTPTNTRGALYQANIYANVTIWYKYLNGDNESSPILFIDDGLGTFNPTGELMHFDEAKTVLAPDPGYGYYNFTFTMNTNFVVFRARYGLYEDDFGLYNIITADGTRVRSFFWEPYYTQLEEISMNLTYYNYNIIGYGFKYRDVTENYNGAFENVTFALVTNGDEGTLNASFSHTFEKGTVVQVQAFIIQYDNMTGTGRVFAENYINTFTVADATPVIELSVPRYTNKLNVSLLWSATVLNGNITAFEINWGDLSGIQIVNISVHRYYHVYASVGEYTINATAYADFLVSNLTVKVLIEQIKPLGSVKIVLPNGTTIIPNPPNIPEIVVEEKQLDFILNANDTGGSGIEMIILSTDEGNSIEISENGQVTMNFLEYGIRDITITVIDRAGNEISESFYINLVMKELPGDIPVPFPFGITTILGLFSVAFLLYLRKKK